MHGADLVACGVADQFVGCVKQDKDLVHTKLLGGWCRPDGFIMGAAVEGDGLTPVVAPGLDAAIG